MAAKLTHPELSSDMGKAIALILRDQNFPTHRIAALFDVNQGRVAEVIGKRREKLELCPPSA